MKLILLRDARLKRGLTQDQLAAESGVDQTTISRLETDPNPNPTLLTRDRLAAALRISPARLSFAKEDTTSISEQRCSAVSPEETEAR